MTAILACTLDNASLFAYYTSTMELTFVALIVALIISVIIHEMAHGYAALWQGDPTAKLQGRLSPNPAVHLDPLMSIIIPGLLIYSNAGFIFGAAKPVPYNPYNFRNQKWGEAIVAFAGPLSNIILALLFIGLIYAAPIIGLNQQFVQLSYQIVILNFFLAFFNLIPLAPLDGSKIIQPFIGMVSIEMMWKYQNFRNFLEQNVWLAFSLVIFIVFFGLGSILHSLTINIVQTLLQLL